MSNVLIEVAASGLRLEEFNPRSQSRPIPGGFGFYAFFCSRTSSYPTGSRSCV